MGRETPKHLLPQGKFPPVRTFHQSPVRWLLRHWVGYYFRRDKRTCPNCAERGHWNAFGLYWKDIDKRRWLCKWCGYMDSVAGQEWCCISTTLTCWVGADSDPLGYTPETVLRDAMSSMAAKDSK